MLDIEIFVKKIRKKSRLMGIDPGKKRVGIAISDENKIVATPLTTIIHDNYSNLVAQIKIIFEENNVEGIVIGFPINMDGTLGRSSQSVRDKCLEMSKKIDIPLCLWDERLSTQAVFNISSQLDINLSKRVKKSDENAAAFILQGAIDFLNN